MLSSINPRTLGIAIALASVVIGAGWQLATRAGASRVLHPFDLMLMRYIIPALILMPLLLRNGFTLPNMSAIHQCTVIASGGLGFGLAAVHGAQWAPAAHMGVLVSGSTPMFVAILLWLVLHKTPNKRLLFGIGLLCTGALLVSSHQIQGNSGFALSSNVLLGDALFVTASILWAIYTVALSKTSINPLHLAAVVTFWSAIGITIIWTIANGLGGPTGWAVSRFANAGTNAIVWHGFMQGIVGGILGTLSYLWVARLLGPVTASGIGAAVPAMTAIGAWLLLAEPLTPLMLLGVGSTVAGILVAQVWAKR
jgi:drug/metabolite transporter (DMT)-like permease